MEKYLPSKGLQHHHVGNLLRGLQRHGALLLGRNAEAAKLEPRGALADTEIEPAVRHNVEGGEPLGGAGRVIVVWDHLPDAMAQADGLCARGGCGQENFRRRGMRILLEKVVFHLPRVVVSQPIGDLHLLQRLMKEIALVALVPGPRQLQLVENSEAHFHPLEILLAAGVYYVEDWPATAVPDVIPALNLVSLRAASAARNR